MVQFDDHLTNSHLGELHRLEEERSMKALAAQLGVEYVDLSGYTLNPDAMTKISETDAHDARVVAFDMHQRTLSVAAKQLDAPKTQAVLQRLQKDYTLKVFLCSTTSLEHAWKRYADFSGSTIEKKGLLEIDAKKIEKLQAEIKSRDDVLRLLKDIRTENSARRVSDTLELIFAAGVGLNASDIHIEPEEEAVRLRYRLDGVLHDILDLDYKIYKRLMSRLKLLSGMILNTNAAAQSGRFTFAMSEAEVEVRSSVIPSALGESIVMRLLDPTSASFTMERVNLNPHIERVMREQLKRPNGLIITTGPTGSGKTTALYAYLQEVHKEGTKIITIENPVEYKLEGIVQTPTSENYTFAQALREILRQDPDVIMVGEIRDEEVARTAIHAAQTGHLVFSTLHTNNAAAAFPRLIDLEIDPRVMGTAVNIIMAQRLIRKLCDHCKTSYEASPEELAQVEFVMNTHPHPMEIPQPLTLHRAVGCEKCGNAGFKGRMGIFEGIIMDEAVEDKVINDPREHAIMEAARPQGIPTMQEDGIEKVILGITSLTELERVVELPHPTLHKTTLPDIQESTLTETE